MAGRWFPVLMDSFPDHIHMYTSFEGVFQVAGVTNKNLWNKEILAFEIYKLSWEQNTEFQVQNWIPRLKFHPTKNTTITSVKP